MALAVFEKPKIKTFRSKSGRECYISGIENKSGIWKCIVKYLDTKEFVWVNYDLMRKYL